MTPKRAQAAPQAPGQPKSRLQYRRRSQRALRKAAGPSERYPGVDPAVVRQGGRRVAPSEHQIQCAFFEFARPYLSSKGIDPRLCYAVPNSQILMASARNKHAVMAYLRAEGFVDGIPDVHLDVPMWSHTSQVCTFHGLRIEAKREGGRPSKEQLEIVSLMCAQGYSVVIAIGLDEMIRALKGYVERCVTLA